MVRNLARFRSTVASGSRDRHATKGWRTVAGETGLPPPRVLTTSDPRATVSHGRWHMARTIIALFLLFALQQANAVECGSTANRSGCVGPNGAATYNKNTGQVHTAKPYHSNTVAPGTTVQGARGNRATKALEPGCAYVNGRRVCN
jgi:hypothetical protein